jgi:SAM-dependent methyltransferase
VPCRIAEIGCGGGGTTLEILRRAPAGSVVEGFDISPALIELARERAQPDESAIAFTIADAARAREGPYDRLASRFGIMFFDDQPAAFANLVRWLAPSGRFAFAVWGGLAENPWMTSVSGAVAEVVDMPVFNPEAPGPFRYGEADRLVNLLERAGFGELDVRDWRGALDVGGSAAEAANFALAAFSSFGELLAKAGDAALNQARQALTARFLPHERDGVVRMDACVHIVTGGRV